MISALRILIHSILGLFALALILHTLIRAVRFFFKFPMPQFLANAIDNPFRRKLQPPDETAARHGLEPGMTVLEIGPGNGTYTIAAARRVGEQGKVITVDIEPRMIERVTRRARREGIDNIEAQVADVCHLPFKDGFFDAIYMITVIGEIPHLEKALKELGRVLAPSGTLALSEVLLDPDYPCATTLIRRAATAGFRLRKKVGNFFYYTLIFEKDSA